MSEPLSTKEFKALERASRYRRLVWMAPVAVLLRKVDYPDEFSLMNQFLMNPKIEQSRFEDFYVELELLRRTVFAQIMRFHPPVLKPKHVETPDPQRSAGALVIDGHCWDCVDQLRSHRKWLPRPTWENMS